jgi:4-diphosphocytidyl-2-C-methyl-D-erythritol kinase
VLGRRADGFHEIRTLFAEVGLADEVTVERTALPGVVCETVGASLPEGPANLAARAAGLWLAQARAPGGARVRLAKRLPVGGGMGGGSSDAAAVLRLLEAGGPPLGPERLRALAASLGSDVPFFLTGGAAVGRGRGERIEPLPPPPEVPVVLLVPPFPTETAAVYRAFERPPRVAAAPALEEAVAALASGDPARLRAAHRNDLAFGAMRAYPDLARFCAHAERLLGRPPCLTGSGSTFFDLPDPGETETVVSRLAPLPGRRDVTSLGGVAPSASGA